MHSSSDSQKSRLEKALKYAELAQATDSVNDPLLGVYYRGLAAGSEQTAGKSAGILDNLLTGPAMLLQLSPGKRADIKPLRREEGVILGRETSTGFPVGLRYEELRLSTCTLGKPGTGKTNLNGIILSQLPARTSKVFIDSKRESSRFGDRFGKGMILRPSQWYDNILEPVGDPIVSRMSRFEHLAAHLNMDDRSWRDAPEMLTAIEATMPTEPRCLSLLDACHVFEAAKGKNSKYGTIANRLWPMARILGDRSRVITGPDIFSRCNWVALDYTGYASNIRNALHAIMLDKVLQKLAVKGHNLEGFAIFWDEASEAYGKEHSSSRPGSGYVSYTRTASSQGRSYGLEQFINAQHASQVDKCSTANSSNLIILAQSDYDEARECSRLLGDGDRLTEQIQQLPIGHAYLRSPSYPKPIRIVTPLMKMGAYRGIEDTDHEVAEEMARMKEEVLWSPERQKPVVSVTYSEVFPQDPRNGTADKSSTIDPADIRDEHRIFVAELLAHPAASIVEHYSNLGWSSGRGHRIKSQLTDGNMIESHKQTSPNGRPVELLVLSEKGKVFFNAHNQS